MNDLGELDTEVLVVGGGSAGCALSARLVEAGLAVTLIEAGPDYGAFDAGKWPHDLADARRLALSHDWGYRQHRWSFERARVLGGCSSHNGCIAAVGHRSDYDGWQLPGWCSDDIAPIFKRVIQAMRIRTYTSEEAAPFHQQCLSAAGGLGWRMASDLCDLDGNDGFGLETVNIVGTTRWNAAFAYLDKIRGSKRFQIVDNALVDRFRETSSGVELWIVRNGEPVMMRGERLVLSAGVYGSPAILQRSGIGAPDHLARVGVEVRIDSIRVGENLHDHPMIHADRRVGPRLQSWLDEVAATGYLPEEQTLGKALSSRASDGLYDLHLFPVCASDQTSELHGKVEILAAGLCPRSRGTLQIVSANPTSAPDIEHNYLGDPEGHDLAVLRDGIRLANELFDHAALSELLGGAVSDTSTPEGARSHVRHYYHPVGTCAMGQDDAAVCDERGRVRGLERVRVADASLIPRIPRANTNLPCVMIGERVAELMLEDERRGD